MYSEFIDRLGLSQNAMELLVLVGLIVVVIGVILVLYWKYIIMGTLAIGCVAVFANHKPVSTVTNKTTEVVEQAPHVDLSEHIDLTEPKKPVEQKDVRKEFMDKCINLADYTRTHCEELWDDRVQEERAILDDKVKGDTNGNNHKI